VHSLYEKADQLSNAAIGAAIEVHRIKGPGLIESIYERCLVRELSLAQIATVNQRVVRIEYKGLVFDEPLRLDVLVENCLLLELKCAQEILPIHKAQLFSYMKLMDVLIGLILNFHEAKLTDGIVRMILPGANQ
jgi:GxxExxY protein